MAIPRKLRVRFAEATRKADPPYVTQGPTKTAFLFSRFDKPGGFRASVWAKKASKAYKLAEVEPFKRQFAQVEPLKPPSKPQFAQVEPLKPPFAQVEPSRSQIAQVELS